MGRRCGGLRRWRRESAGERATPTNPDQPVAVLPKLSLRAEDANFSVVCLGGTHFCMRTTLDLDDHLLSRAKRRAHAEGRTLTAFIEGALAAALAPRPQQGRRFRLHLETDHGRFIGGVDIADRDALYDVMKGRR